MTDARSVALLILALATLLAGGCRSTAPVSTITTQPDGLRTFSWPDEVLCTLGKAVQPVTGVLRGQQGAQDPVWLESPDGQHLSVIWPAGFSVAFAPAAALRDEKGHVLAREGDTVTFGQVNLETAAGTFEDPYVASGSVGDGCYPYVTG